MDLFLEHNIATSPSTAIRNMICVISQTPKAMTPIEPEIPVYQQNFSIFLDMIYGTSTYNSWKLWIYTPEEKQTIEYLFLVICGYWNDDYKYWCFYTWNNFFPQYSFVCSTEQLMKRIREVSHIWFRSW